MRVAYRAKFLLTFISLTALLAGLFYYLHFLAIWNWNNNQLEKYTENALHRTELVVDNTILRVRDAPAIENAGCSSASMADLRKNTYLNGIIRQIRVRENGMECWVFDIRGLDISEMVTKATRLRAQNPNYQLFTLKSDILGAMGIEWQENSRETITALVGIGHLLYDVLPPDIRDEAEIYVSLNNDDIVSRYPPGKFEPGHFADPKIYKALSSRYPLTARLVVSSSILDSWNRAYPAYLVIPALIVMAAIAFLITRGIIRDTGLAGELDTAIAKKEILPFYQPIYNLRTGDVTGFEMLARWIKFDGQTIAPNRFIPFAEETGRIDAILELLLQTAGEEVGPLLHKRPDLKLTFNVTPQQFLAEGFVERLENTLGRSRIPLVSCVVEVTERQSIDNPDNARAVSSELAKIGVRTAIDDAGAGHNGLSSIHSLNAHFLKIDKYFIDAILLDHKSLTIIEMLKSVAREFGMTIVAEGIETREQAELLAKIGIEQGQGYYFSRPVPAAALRDLANPGMKAAIA